MHERGIIHRDLKPANILIVYPRGNTIGLPVMKLADFGLCHVVRGDRSEFSFSKIAGSEGWMAPEMLQKETERFSYLVDIFPLGLLFYYILSRGLHPYGSSPIERVSRIANNQPMKLTEQELGCYATDGIFELIQLMLNPKPKQRPSAATILQHPILNKRVQQQDVLVNTFNSTIIYG